MMSFSLYAHYPKNHHSQIDSIIQNNDGLNKAASGRMYNLNSKERYLVWLNNKQISPVLKIASIAIPIIGAITVGILSGSVLVPAGLGIFSLFILIDANVSLKEKITQKLSEKRLSEIRGACCSKVHAAMGNLVVSCIHQNERASIRKIPPLMFPDPYQKIYRFKIQVKEEGNSSGEPKTPAFIYFFEEESSIAFRDYCKEGAITQPSFTDKFLNASKPDIESKLWNWSTYNLWEQDISPETEKECIPFSQYKKEKITSFEASCQFINELVNRTNERFELAPE